MSEDRFLSAAQQSPVTRTTRNSCIDGVIADDTIGNPHKTAAARFYARASIATRPRRLRGSCGDLERFRAARRTRSKASAGTSRHANRRGVWPWNGRATMTRDS